MPVSIPSSNELPRIGDMIAGRYRVDAVLGEGSQALVLRAFDAALRRTVAIKIVRPEAIPAAPDELRDHERFRREAQLLARLDSPYLPKIFDVCELVGGVPYLVVEYLQGRSLQDELHAAPTAIGIGHAARWIAQVCHALAQAHSRGIIHRDVKPGNIVLVRDSAGVATVRLVDFGIAKVLWTDSTVPLGVTQEAALGSIAYMAPEQLNHEAGDERSDLYALGVSLFEILTKRLPFDANTVPTYIAAALLRPPTSLRSVRPDAPEALELVVNRVLAKKPTDRYQSAAEMGEALLPFFSESATEVQHQLRASRTQEVSASIASSGVWDRLTELAFSDLRELASILAAAQLDSPESFERVVFPRALDERWRRFFTDSLVVLAQRGEQARTLDVVQRLFDLRVREDRAWVTSIAERNLVVASLGANELARHADLPSALVDQVVLRLGPWLFLSASSAAREVASACSGPVADRLSSVMENPWPRDVDRARAVHVLGWLGLSRAFGVVVDRLSDPAASVRSAATWALSVIDASQAPTHLLPLLRDPEWGVQESAAAALARVGYTAAIPELLAAWRNRPDRVGATPFALSVTELDADRGVPLLLEGIEVPHNLVGFTEAAALARVARGDTIARVQGLLAREEPYVRMKAAVALMRVQRARAVETLTKLTSHRDTTVRGLALRQIGDTGAVEAADVVVRAMEMDAETWVRAEAAEALARLPVYYDVAHLISPLLRDGSVMTRLSAAGALERAAPQMALDVARSIVRGDSSSQQPSPMEVSHGVELLGRVGVEDDANSIIARSAWAADNLDEMSEQAGPGAGGSLRRALLEGLRSSCNAAIWSLAKRLQWP